MKVVLAVVAPFDAELTAPFRPSSVLFTLIDGRVGFERIQYLLVSSTKESAMGNRPTVCVKRVSINPDGKLCSPSAGYAQEMDIFHDEWEMFIELQPSVLDAPTQAFPRNAPLTDVALNKQGHLLRKIQ